MSPRLLKQRANTLETEIGVHRQKALQLRQSLQQRLHDHRTLWVPLGGALSGALLARYSLTTVIKQGWRWSGTLWLGLRWMWQRVQ